MTSGPKGREEHQLRGSGGTADAGALKALAARRVGSSPTSRTTAVRAYAGDMERKPDDIVREIDATRERLVQNIDEIADRVQPEEIAKRTAAKLERGAKQVAGQVKGYYVDEASGQVRQDRAMKTGAIALGFLMLRKLLK